MKEKPWNTCDYCGKFIAIADFESGVAIRTLISHDTVFSAEEFENVCKACLPKAKPEYTKPT